MPGSDGNVRQFLARSRPRGGGAGRRGSAERNRPCGSAMPRDESLSGVHLYFTVTFVPDQSYFIVSSHLKSAIYNLQATGASHEICRDDLPAAAPGAARP